MLKPYPLAGRETRQNADGDQSVPVPPFFATLLSPEDTDATEPGDFGFEGGRPDCSRMTAYLSAYLDGELDADTQAVVESHLNRCEQCVGIYDAMLATDESIQREWRENAPLPSPSETRFAVNAIMDALPSVPAETAVFAPKRVHARARWIRFATGIAGVMAILMGLLWSSYKLGYEQGRLSILPNPTPTPNALPAANPAPRRLETSRLTPAFSLPSAFRSLPAFVSLPPPAPFPLCRRAIGTS